MTTVFVGLEKETIADYIGGYRTVTRIDAPTGDNEETRTHPEWRIVVESRARCTVAVYAENHTGRHYTVLLDLGYERTDIQQSVLVAIDGVIKALESVS